MTHLEALDRVKKLLALAKSDNPNEAASAAAMAQKIIDRHKLDVASLEGDSGAPTEKVEDTSLDTSTSTWKLRLAGEIARANGCRLYYRPGQSIQLIGRASDAQTVRYLYQWLTKEIDRLTRQATRPISFMSEPVSGKTWANNFRLGCVETLGRRLSVEKEETKREAQAEAFAKEGEAGLARINQAIVRVADTAPLEAYAATLKLRSGSARRSAYDGGAREAGRRAGASISLGGSRGAMGAGARRMGSGS